MSSYGLLAQQVEQRPFKAWVTGSNPVQLKAFFAIYAKKAFFFIVIYIKKCGILIKELKLDEVSKW